MNTAQINKQIEKHVDAVYALATAHVETLARKVLREHPNLDEFVMAMGSATFTRKGDALDSLDLDDREYMKTLRDFINQWNDHFGITGIPMRFTADGPVVRDW